MSARALSPQRSPASSGPARSPAGSARSAGSAGSAGSAQAGAEAGVGNAALAAGLGGRSAPTFDDGTPIPQHRGPEVTAGFDPATRAARFEAGEKGALIGKGTDVLVRSGQTSRSRELGRVADGTPCEVISSKGAAVQVRVRLNNKMVVGWVEAASFSVQPGMIKSDEDPALTADFPFAFFGGDHDPTAPKGTDTAQGALGDCFFIASMAAVANANPQAISEAITYDKASGKYTVRFYEEGRGGSMKPVYITVDAYLPTSGARNDPAFAGDPGQPLWPAIMEKAYAQWKGGYDVIGEGGVGDTAMAEISGVRSRSKNPASMKESEVIPYFEAASKSGLAVYAGVRNTSQGTVQQPLTGGSGKYSGQLRQNHAWSEVEPGTLRVTDAKGRVQPAYDEGEEGDKTGAMKGKDLSGGSIDYKGSRLDLQYRSGKQPESASDLSVQFEFHGMMDPAKVIIGNHAYAFERVVGKDQLQFYNPWGSYQPKPITAAEFLRHFDALSTNAVPKGKTGR